MMTLTQKLLTVAKAYSVLCEKPLSAVSRQFFGSGPRLKTIEEGGTLTIRTYEKAMSDFARCWPDPEQWPDGVDWPSDIPRPLCCDHQPISSVA